MIKQSFWKLWIFYLCQNLVFMSNLIHRVDFCLANVNLRVSKWYATYPANSISCCKYTWLYKCLALYFHHDSPWSNARMIEICWVENVFEKRNDCVILQNNLKMCSLLVASLFFVVVVVARCRLFQVVVDRFLLVVGRFSSFQVVSCSLYVVWGRVSSFCFLLVVGRFK